MLENKISKTVFRGNSQGNSIIGDPQPSTSSGIESNTTSSFKKADNVLLNSNELSDILNNLDNNFFVPESNEQRNSEIGNILSSNESSQGVGSSDAFFQTLPVQEELSNTEPTASGSGLDNAFGSLTFSTNHQVNDLDTILSEAIQLHNDVVPLPNSTEEILEKMPSFFQSAAAETAITDQQSSKSDIRKGAGIVGGSKSNQSEDVELIVLSAPIKATGVLKVKYEKKSGSVDKVESIPLGVLKKDFVKLIAEKESYNRRKQ